MTPEPHAVPSASPPFATLGVVFSAWNVTEGSRDGASVAHTATAPLPGSARTVWVSTCGRIRCGGRVVSRQPTDIDARTTRMAYWCRVDGRLIETDAGALLHAMQAGALFVARPDSAGAEPAGTRDSLAGAA